MRFVATASSYGQSLQNEEVLSQDEVAVVVLIEWKLSIDWPVYKPLAVIMRLQFKSDQRRQLDRIGELKQWDGHATEHPGPLSSSSAVARWALQQLIISAPTSYAESG